MSIKTEYLTQHGLPLNCRGKEVICKQIGTIIDKLFQTEKILLICNFTAPLFTVKPLWTGKPTKLLV
jgi:hypothetical protein